MNIKNISGSGLFDVKIMSNELTPPGYELEPLDAGLYSASTVSGVSGEQSNLVIYLDDCDLQCVSNGVYELVRTKENGGCQREITTP